MEVIYLQMPARDWDEVVSLLENTCGVSSDEIEILQNVKVQWRGTPED